jgi:hypothetical protein
MPMSKGEMKMIQAIDNAGICVTDMARSVAFYEKLSFMKAFENG